MNYYFFFLSLGFGVFFGFFSSDVVFVFGSDDDDGFLLCFERILNIIRRTMNAAMTIDKIITTTVNANIVAK